MEERGFFRRWGLIVPAVLAPAAETAVLALTGLRDAISLAPPGRGMRAGAERPIGPDGVPARRLGQPRCTS